MDRLQPPFYDIVGESSPIQKAIKLIWDIFANAPVPDNGSAKSQSAAKSIMLYMLRSINSIGMINAAGYHSAAVTLLRSIEDALDCFSAVVHSDLNACKWLDGELKASEAAKTWTENKIIDQTVLLGDYRKSIRGALNKYSHYTPSQTSWNLYKKQIADGKCTVEYNYKRAVIRVNGYYIDRYLCIHLYEIIDVIKLYYSNYFSENDGFRTILNQLGAEIEKIITDFLNDIGVDKLYMDAPPELTDLKVIE